MSGATIQAPAGGMQRIPLSFETYQDASLPMSAKYLLNLYAEKTPSDARAPFKLTPTPGLIDSGWGPVGASPVTAINEGSSGRDLCGLRGSLLPAQPPAGAVWSPW